MSANFNPTLNKYKIPRDFRFWCQKVIPLVYDDSLSYYEVLCKVVNYINHLIKDDKLMAEDIIKLNSAFLELQDYVNKYFSEYQNRAFISYENYINSNNYMNEMPDLNECLINNTYRLLFTNDEVNNNTCTLNMPSGLNWSNEINSNCNFGIIKNIDNFTTDEDKDNGYLNTQLFIFVDRENNKVNLFVRTKTVETKTTTTEILNGETVEVTRTTTQYTDWTDLFKNVNDTLESLQSQITAEVDRATNAENVLSERLDAETEARTQADDVLTESIKRVETESAERDEQLGDRINNLNTALNSEISRATNAENNITTNLNNEISRAQDAENELETKISNEVVRAQNIENGLRSDLDDEITRATEAENNLSNRITNNYNSLQDDIGTVEENLSDEIHRAETTENNLQEQIDNLTNIASKRNLFCFDVNISEGGIVTPVNYTGELGLVENDVVIMRVLENKSTEGLSDVMTLAYNDNYVTINYLTDYTPNFEQFIENYINIFVYKNGQLNMVSDANIQSQINDLKLNVDVKDIYNVDGIVTENGSIEPQNLSDNIVFSNNDLLIARITENNAVDTDIMDISFNGHLYNIYTFDEYNGIAKEVARAGCILFLKFLNNKFYYTYDNHFYFLTERIDNEITRATEAENVLSERLDAETEARTQGDDLLTEKINDEVTRAQDEENNLETLISNEVVRAQNIENGLRSDLDDEITRAKTAESALGGNINNINDFISSIAKIYYNRIMPSNIIIDDVTKYIIINNSDIEIEAGTTLILFFVQCDFGDDSIGIKINNINYSCVSYDNEGAVSLYGSSLSPYGIFIFTAVPSTNGSGYTFALHN